MNIAVLQDIFGLSVTKTQQKPLKNRINISDRELRQMIDPITAH